MEYFVCEVTLWLFVKHYRTSYPIWNLVLLALHKFLSVKHPVTNNNQPNILPYEPNLEVKEHHKTCLLFAKLASSNLQGIILTSKDSYPSIKTRNWSFTVTSTVVMLYDLNLHQSRSICQLRVFWVNGTYLYVMLMVCDFGSLSMNIRFKDQSLLTGSSVYFNLVSEDRYTMFLRIHNMGPV